MRKKPKKKTWGFVAKHAPKDLNKPGGQHDTTPRGTTPCPQVVPNPSQQKVKNEKREKKKKKWKVTFTPTLKYREGFAQNTGWFFCFVV